MKFVKLFSLLVLILLMVGCATTTESKESMSTEEIDLKEEVTEAKMKAYEEGNYLCCLNTPCDQCIVNMGACPCHDNLVEGKPVCHECKGGWDAGDGAIEGINPEDVEVMPRGEM